MAEYALRSLLERERPGRAEIISAGTLGLVDRPATDYAQEAAKVWNLDLSRHRSQPLTKGLIEGADLVFAMAPEHYREVVRLAKTAGNRTYLLKNFPDNSPSGEGLKDPQRRGRDAFEGRVRPIAHLPRRCTRPT